MAIDRPDKLGQVLGGVQRLAGSHRMDDKCVRQLEVDARFAAADAGVGLLCPDLSLPTRNGWRLAQPAAPAQEHRQPRAAPSRDLPANLVDRYVGQHGKYLLKIFGRGDIWDTQALERFVNDVRSVDPQVTGNPLQATKPRWK